MAMVDTVEVTGNAARVKPGCPDPCTATTSCKASANSPEVSRGKTDK